MKDTEKDSLQARKHRAEDLRKRIKAITAGNVPADNKPMSPREYTDRAAQAEFERSKGKKADAPRPPKGTIPKPE